MRQERGFLGIQRLRLNTASAGGPSSISLIREIHIPHATHHGQKSFKNMRQERNISIEECSGELLNHGGVLALYPRVRN